MKCCLRFEVDAYREARNTLPKVGDTLRTPQGMGKVVDVYIIKESVLVRLDESGERVELNRSQLKKAGFQPVAT